MGTMVETEMDQFIRNHKQNLQKERNDLDDRERYAGGPQVTSPSNRKQWDRGRNQETKPAEEMRPPQQPADLQLQLGNDDYYENKKKKLQLERQKEYNELMNKKGPGTKRRPRTPSNDGLPLGNYTEQRKALDKERNKEMKAAMSQKQQKLRQEYERETAEAQRIANEQGTSFEQQEYQSKHRQLEEEKKREYQEYLAEKQRAQRREMPVGTGATLPVGEYSDTRKQELFSERQKEYQQLQQEKQLTDRRRGLPPKPPTPNHFFKNLGEHDRQTEALNEERKKEYNQNLTAKNYRSGGRNAPSNPNAGGTLALGGTDSAEIRKMKARNNEYNDFLQDKKHKDAHRFDSKKPPSERRHSNPSSPRARGTNGALLPGLNYSDSADKRKMQERNREYNDFLKQKQNRKTGWGTPTYEEILEQKRREESLRRQDEEGPGRMRSFHSEGALNRLEDNLRARELDKEFEARKVRFDDERNIANGILEDDNWLKPERREQQYQNLTEPPPPPIREDMTAVRQPYNSTLMVGHDERNSAQTRRKQSYAKELQLQMEENRAARTRERRQELPVNASGLINPEQSSNRLKGIGGGQIVSPRREYKANDVQRYHSKFLVDDSGDSLQLNLGGGGFERGRRRDRDVGILDTGITGLLEQRRNVGVINPPPGLMYQPSTYVTGGGGGLYGPADEAYHYYAMKNPLDVDVGSGVPGLNLGGDFGGRRGSPTRVTFRDPDSPLPSHRKRDRSKERISPYQFPSDDDNRSRSRQDTLSYGAELERQIAEKRAKKQMERQEQDRYERKLEEDIKNYNPFGRGGGGAPIKDGSGNAIADLRSIQRGNMSDRHSPPRQQQQFQPSGSFSPRPPSPRDDKIRPPPAQHNAVGDATYARGGHGIFGQPKTEAEKDVTDKYKDELRQQIADKRRREQMDKDREKAEEEKENRRLEDQRIRMQSEYDEEQKKIRAREEEARKKNEELKNLAEEKKKESERKKREVEDSKMREQQEQIERERQEKQTEEKRSKSPPLPAHRKDRDTPRATSRASRASSRAQQSPAPGPSIERQNSSDVLTQLASMRKQLQSERRRVEQALENSQNEPQVFDPRTIQRPPPNKLIFENAMNKNASLPPPRAQTSDMANARNIQQFNELKFKSDSDSRRAFRSMFPEAPVTNNTLEAQQDAMIRQQEDYLRNLRDKNPFENPTSLGYGRHGNNSARSQLAANSAFIDVDGVNHFPEDFEDMAGMRNDSARARRRDRFSPRIPSVNGMGSNSSLDVDRIQMKNEERLRKLQQMTTGDEVSMGDPDDILERFMAKQRYNRPPSGQTLQDDTWLRPGSKVV